MNNSYNAKPLPGHYSQYTKIVLSGLAASAVAFIGIIVFAKLELTILSTLSTVLFVLSCIYVLAYPTYKLKHVKCPTCARRCESHKDQMQNEWVTDCPDCQVRWRLGISTRSKNW